jgi:hypothetical protein
MPTFTESNITLNFPDTNFFHFSSCKGYKALSRNHFKEMDACWFEANNNLYWLFELKDYSAASLALPETMEKKSWDMVKKAIDSLCMFLSSKHAYPYALDLNPCFPPPLPTSTTQFKFVTIVHCNEEQKADVQLINEKFKNKFRPYAQLFGITNYSVVEHSAAVRKIPNNIVQ